MELFKICLFRKIWWYKFTFYMRNYSLFRFIDQNLLIGLQEVIQHICWLLEFSLHLKYWSRIVLNTKMHYLCPFFWFVANLSWPLWHFFQIQLIIHCKFSIVFTLILTKITLRWHDNKKKFHQYFMLFF